MQIYTNENMSYTENIAIFTLIRQNLDKLKVF